MMYKECPLFYRELKQTPDHALRMALAGNCHFLVLARSLIAVFQIFNCTEFVLLIFAISII